jgi:hypothetical protein
MGSHVEGDGGPAISVELSLAPLSLSALAGLNTEQVSAGTRGEG